MLSDLPYNYDASGKLQHSLFCKDIVLCLCYQPPYHTYKHPNQGQGVYSQGVYVVSGTYTCTPLNSIVGNEPEPAIHLEGGNFYNLEKYKSIPTEDTAGPDGVMMIHFNPISGSNEFDFQLVKPGSNLKVSNQGLRTIVFCLEEGVEVNGVELSLLNRVRVYNNNPINIDTHSGGTAIVLTKKANTDSLEEKLVIESMRRSTWSAFHNFIRSRM